jgi:hypothetical protein
VGKTHAPRRSVLTQNVLHSVRPYPFRLWLHPAARAQSSSPWRKPSNSANDKVGSSLGIVNANLASGTLVAATEDAEVRWRPSATAENENVPLVVRGRRFRTDVSTLEGNLGAANYGSERIRNGAPNCLMGVTVHVPNIMIANAAIGNEVRRSPCTTL